MFGRDEKVSGSRLTAVQYIILVVFLVLAYGLWRLQVVQSEFYAALAEKNKTREVPILAPRGKILDREGRVIVDNYPSFTALLLRDSTRDLSGDADLIAQGLHLDPKEVKDRLRKFAGTPQYQPIYLKEDITPDELAFIESHHNELPELDTIMAHRRLYPRNGFMAHLVGYVGEVSEQMLNQARWELYNPGDVVGKSGVELQYNQVLMGKNGSRQVLVNSKGKEVGELDEKPAVPGHNLKLTVDIDLQIAAEEAMGDKNGAMVAMDPHTGEILAMVSRPTFDPNDFAVRISRGEWNKLVTDPDKPLLNKAIQAQLAPGSTFKILMSVAGWQENIAQTLNVHCNGGATFYGRRFGCWVKSGHGAVDLTKAIYQSCDVFFYTLAEKLGIDRMAKYATMMGLGQKTGIDLAGRSQRRHAVGRMEDPELQAEMVCGRNHLSRHRTGRSSYHAGATDARDLCHLHGWTHGCTPRRQSRADSRPGYRHPALHRSEEPFRLKRQVERHYRCDGARPAAGRHGTFCPRSRHRYRRKDRLGADCLPGLRAKHQNNEFASERMVRRFHPRRNPDIVVCVLFQGGEHGKLAARLATQVIKAYVDKQRRQPTKVASTSGDVPVGAPWNGGPWETTHSTADI